MPESRTQAPPAVTFRLWPSSEAAEPSAKDWHEAVELGDAVGWVHIRGTPDAARSALTSLAVPGLDERVVAKVLQQPAANAPPVRNEGPLRVVVASIPTLSQRSDGESTLVLVDISLIASDAWVISYAAAREGERPDAVDLATEAVDLRPDDTISRSGGALGLRVLLEIAELWDSTVTRATRLLERATTERHRLAALEVLDTLERRLAELRRRGRPIGRTWFEAEQDSDAQDVADLLDAALNRVSISRDQALELEARERDAGERRRTDALQAVLGTIAAVLLGPSLVAGIFDAFPEWQPIPSRGESFLGFCLISGGILLLLIYLVPPVLVPQRRKAQGTTVAVGVALSALVGGLVLALPLRTDTDETPPEIKAACPARVAQGSRATAVVAASDAESDLKVDPSGFRPIPSKKRGPVTRTFRALDSFGQASTASCTYRVVPSGRRGR